ncbi:hypothetical protein [Nonomuraea sp. NPDC049750]|uniref:hypothetical protein n=1 Tax=Nonomuraea sp. NPDC049750 TaxID=3154738 RepID=UPI00340F4E62
MTPGAARTSISRLARGGVLEGSRQGRYGYAPLYDGMWISPDPHRRKSERSRRPWRARCGDGCSARSTWNWRRRLTAARLRPGTWRPSRRSMKHSPATGARWCPG